MKINGTTVPTAFVIPAAAAIFWLGGLSITVATLASDEHDHEEKAAHEGTAVDIATIKLGLVHNKEAISEVKKKMESDKQEILKAIRDQ